MDSRDSRPAGSAKWKVGQAPGRYAEFRKGWRVLLASACGIVCGVTVVPFNTLGAMVAPLNELYGWGRSDVQLAYLLFAISSSTMYPVVGRLADLYGARRVAVVSLPCFALAFAGIGLAGDSLLLFYAGWTLLGILGAGTAPVTFTRALNEWFVVNRGFALAIALCLTGATTAFYQFSSTWLVERVGWQVSFVALALIPLVFAWPLVLLFLPQRQAAVAAPRRTHEGRASRRRVWINWRYWVLASSILLVTFSVSGIILNLKPLLDDRGIAPEAAAGVAAIIGLCTAVSRLGTGFLVDRIWAPAIAFPVFALPVASCWLLAQPDLTVGMAMAAVVLIGIAVGAEADLMAFLTVKYFGLQDYGQLYGMLFGIFMLSSGVAPYVFGLVFDRIGNYEPILLFSAVSFAAAAVLMLCLGRYPSPERTTED